MTRAPRRWRTSLLVAATIVLVASTGNVARAVEPGVSHDPPDPPIPPRAPSADDDLVSARSRRTWSEGPARVFFATTLDVGWVYARPRASVGWGRPFNDWVGIDVNPVVASQGMGIYGGLRFALPRFDLRLGPRYLFAFGREYLVPQDSYDRLDLSSTAGRPARIVTYEAEAEFSLPLGPGDVVGLASGSYVTNIPRGMFVFEETLRVIVDPPWVIRGRGGYLYRFGTYGQHNVGLVVDYLTVPERSGGHTVRFGPVVRIVLSRHVEVRGSFVPTLYGPDKLGLTGGDFTELGFRYRFATE